MFVARTNHSPLQYPKFLKYSTVRPGRWFMLLQDYDTKIEKNKSNVVADALSTK